MRRCTTAGLCRIAAVLVGLAALCVVARADARGGHCRHDADCDGISNQDERLLGTSVRSADTDHDGLSDLREVESGTDPTVADSDGDGENDGDEVAGHSDPSDADSDDDGTPDGEDDDPMDERAPRVAGPVDAVDAVTKTLTLFGCLTIDASTAELEDGLSLDALVVGTFVKVKLDGTKLPALVALSVEIEGGEDN